MILYVFATLVTPTLESLFSLSCGTTFCLFVCLYVCVFLSLVLSLCVLLSLTLAQSFSYCFSLWLLLCLSFSEFDSTVVPVPGPVFALLVFSAVRAYLFLWFYVSLTGALFGCPRASFSLYSMPACLYLSLFSYDNTTCIYVCLCSVRVHVCMCMWVCMRVCVRMCAHVCARLCVVMPVTVLCVCVCACMCACLCACVRVCCLLCTHLIIWPILHTVLQLTPLTKDPWLISSAQRSGQGTIQLSTEWQKISSSLQSERSFIVRHKKALFGQKMR